MRKFLNVFIVVFLLLAVGCNLYPNDKMWLSDEKYAHARAVYDTCGSLDLTRTALADNPTYLPAEINEAMYRLKKQFRLD